MNTLRYKDIIPEETTVESLSVTIEPEITQEVVDLACSLNSNLPKMKVRDGHLVIPGMGWPPNPANYQFVIKSLSHSFVELDTRQKNAEASRNHIVNEYAKALGVPGV